MKKAHLLRLIGMAGAGAAVNTFPGAGVITLPFFSGMRFSFFS
jgi:hypothetical protein